MIYENFWELSFGIVSIATGLLSFFLALAIFLGNPSLKENKIWSLASVCVGVWGIGVGFSALAPNVQICLIWSQVLFSGAVWIPTTFLWFVSTFTKKEVQKYFLWICIGISFVLMVLIWLERDLFLGSIESRGVFRYWITFGPAYHLFSLLFLICMSYSLYLLFRSLSLGSAKDRKKIKWIFIGFFFGIVGGSTTFFYDYNIDIFPFGQFLVFLYPLLISYAVIRYQAMDIGVLLRKTGYLISIYIFLILLILPVLFLINRQVQPMNHVFTPLFLLEILLSAVILSLGPFIYASVIQRSTLFKESTISALTHELKSPVAIIEGSLEMIQDASNNLTDRQKSYLDVIDKNINRLKTYVDDLLVTFGGDDKSKVLNREQHDIVEIINSLCQEFSKNHKVDVHFENHSTPSINLLIDKDRICHVVSNLISNGLKFSSKLPITVKLSEQIKSVKIEVVDQGVGIDLIEQGSLFQRFYQGKEGLRKKGTGVGLYVAKLWVEAHGGHIDVYSTGKGQGATFWFEIPKYD